MNFIELACWMTILQQYWNFIFAINWVPSFRKYGMCWVFSVYWRCDDWSSHDNTIIIILNFFSANPIQCLYGIFDHSKHISLSWFWRKNGKFSGRCYRYGTPKQGKIELFRQWMLGGCKNWSLWLFFINQLKIYLLLHWCQIHNLRLIRWPLRVTSFMF